MRKAQISTQLVISIVTVAVVLVLLVLLGKWISLQRGESVQADFSGFESSLQEIVDSASTYKGVSRQELVFPHGTDTIYVFDTSKDTESLSFREKAVIDDVQGTGALENVFLMSGGKIVHSFVLEGLDMSSPHYVCVENKGNRYEVLVSGRESGAHIEAADETTDCTIPVLVREVVSEVEGTLDGEEFQEMLDYYASAVSRSGHIDVSYTTSYDPYSDTTTVRLVFSSDITVRNFQFYEYIPKCLMLSAAPGSFSHSVAPDTTDILRQDPLVMWNFAEVEDGQEISFSLDRKITDVCEELLSGFGVGMSPDLPLVGYAIGLSSQTVGTGLRVRASPFIDYDGDGTLDGTDAYPDDYDNDAFPDSWETEYGYNNGDAASPGPGDEDDDGLPNDREYDFDTHPRNNDTDNDGASDSVEVSFHTDPNDMDTEDDRMPDGWEISEGLDPLLDDAADDPDHDFLQNYDEYVYVTLPLNEDSDDDGLLDGIEVALGLDPNNIDSDGDGILDVIDAFPDDPLEWTDTDGDGYGNNIDPDDDNDGIPDGLDTDGACHFMFCFGCDLDKCDDSPVCRTKSFNIHNHHLTMCIPAAVPDNLLDDPVKLRKFLNCRRFKRETPCEAHNCNWCMDLYSGSCMPSDYVCLSTGCNVFPPQSIASPDYYTSNTCFDASWPEGLSDDDCDNDQVANVYCDGQNCAKTYVGCPPDYICEEGVCVSVPQ